MTEEEKIKQTPEKKDKAKAKNEGKKQNQLQKAQTMPLSVRLSNILIGTIFVAIAAFIVFNENLSSQIAILIFGAILVISGFLRIVNSFYDSQMGGTKRLVRFVFGTMIFFLGLTALIFQTLGKEFLIIVVAIGISLQGFNRVYLSVVNKMLPLWTRAILLFIGIFAILIAAIVLYDVQFTTDGLIIALAFGFFFGGWSRMSLGLAGIQTSSRKTK